MNKIVPSNYTFDSPREPKPDRTEESIKKKLIRISREVGPADVDARINLFGD